MLQERKVRTLTDAACHMWQPQAFRERSNGRPLSKRASACLPPWAEHACHPVKCQVVCGTHVAGTKMGIFQARMLWSDLTRSTPASILMHST